MTILSLRDKKSAKTKKSITDAFLKRLQDMAFEDIPIKEICNEVEISEATFYNYFPKKTDVICYFATLSILKTFWIVFHQKKHLSPLKKIEMIFEIFAKKMGAPNIFFQVATILFDTNISLQEYAICEDEKKYLYPDCEGIEDIDFLTLHEVFEALLNEACELSLIRTTYCSKNLSILLVSMLVGTPMSLKVLGFDKLLNIYKLHISILWNQIQC